MTIDPIPAIVINMVEVEIMAILTKIDMLNIIKTDITNALIIKMLLKAMRNLSMEISMVPLNMVGIGIHRIMDIEIPNLTIETHTTIEVPTMMVVMAKGNHMMIAEEHQQRITEVAMMEEQRHMKKESPYIMSTGETMIGEVDTKKGEVVMKKEEVGTMTEEVAMKTEEVAMKTEEVGTMTEEVAMITREADLMIEETRNQASDQEVMGATLMRHQKMCLSMRLKKLGQRFNKRQLLSLLQEKNQLLISGIKRRVDHFLWRQLIN